jgi:hypothetical protein
LKHSIFFNMKPWYQSLTVWVALGQAALAVLAEVSTADPSLHLAGYVLILKSVVDILLRLRTTQPIN